MSNIKTLRFKGKNVNYRNITDLSTQLNITKPEARIIKGDIESGNTLRYLIKGENIGRYDITKRPLLFREFGIGGVSNKRLTKDKSKVKGVKIVRDIDNEKDANLLLKYNFKFIISSERFTGTNKKNI